MRYLIIGNGAAGVTAAETIRQYDPVGEVVIVSAEKTPMYSRPGLAYVLTGDIPPQQVVARTEHWYTDQRLKLVYGKAAALDTSNRLVALNGGQTLPYDRLLIATGAAAVPAPYPGGDLDGVVFLDSLEGVRHLLKKVRRARRAVVIGGGITALEMVEGLARRGVETHYFVRRDRLWSKVFNQSEGALLEQQMRHHGIHIHYHTEAVEILGNRRNKVTGVRLKNGNTFACDLFGVAIGVRPQLDLVRGTDILTDRAILVDEYLESNVTGVFAAGDCAQVYDRWSGKHLADSLWPSAVAIGRAAALNMVGKRTVYDKGTPFNVCMLFGLHVTAIGQINPDPRDEDGMEQAHNLSRGSSEVWFTFPRTYNSAWSDKGDSSLRLVLDNTKLVGALIIGEQSAADPLRKLIEHGADAAPLLSYIDDRAELLHRITLLAQAQEVAAL
ncbi:MAG: FAD-dependent oxidoreductase [Anaerolineae bacterium]|nr:FAD-dependent oxidoreductase [Anaerolineae bacterium]